MIEQYKNFFILCIQPFKAAKFLIILSLQSNKLKKLIHAIILQLRHSVFLLAGSLWIRLDKAGEHCSAILRYIADFKEPYAVQPLY